MTTFFKDAPGPKPIPIPRWALELGFKDQSWHNEAMARLEYEIEPHYAEQEPDFSGCNLGGLVVTLWITNEAKEDRDDPDADMRFVGLLTTTEGKTILTLDPGTDDEKRFQRCITVFMDALFMRKAAISAEKQRSDAQKEAAGFSHIITYKGYVINKLSNGTFLIKDGQGLLSGQFADCWDCVIFIDNLLKGH